jgi:serine/threonine protein kinase
LKLTDFGISQQINCEKDKNQNGTKHFIAPEILMSTENYDSFKTDIFSLGVTFYIMSQGKSPWPKIQHMPINEVIINGFFTPPVGLDPQFFDIICNMLELKPNERKDASALLKHPLFNIDQKMENHKKFAFPCLFKYHQSSKMKAVSMQYKNQFNQDIFENESTKSKIILSKQNSKLKVQTF